MKGLSAFLRSVLPTDRAQLAFLTGVVCLILAARTFLRPAYSADAMVPVAFLAFAVWPVIFSGMAGYFVCFWPGNRPVRRILFAVWFPPILTLIAICGWFLYIDNPPISVFETKSAMLSRIGSSLRMLWSLGSGPRFCVAGIVLTAMFIYRLGSKRTSLPLSLSADRSPEFQNGSWHRLQFLVWILVGPWILVIRLLSLSAAFLILFSHRFHLFVSSGWGLKLDRIVIPASLLGATAWIVGREEWQVTRQSLRVPEPKYLGLGVLFPVGISSLISMSQFLVGRFQWAHGFGDRWEPQLESYFALPDPWLFLLFFAAFAEEIVFRGLLQQRFIERYGKYRGVFLVGVVWAAIHFSSDRYSGASDLEVVLNLADRILICLALGFVFSWLTLRSGSILPAAIAHTLYNISVFSQPNFAGQEVIRLALWIALAYVLFRYWPVAEIQQPEDPLPKAAPQPA